MTKEEVLQQCTIDGNIVRLPAFQLDRKLYTEVSKSLELIGGKWKGGKVAGFVFPEGYEEELESLLGKISSGDKVNIKKETQAFFTPSILATRLVQLAEIEENEIILEPEAGQGAIIDAILEKFSMAEIFCCEKSTMNQIILNKKYPISDYEINHNVIIMHPLNDDFLNLKCNQFDKIIANPPFSNNQDIDHIYQMYKFLKDGGRIVTIASTHWIYSMNNKEREFKKWLSQVEAEVIEVEAGAFKESGTMVGSVIIVINK